MSPSCAMAADVAAAYWNFYMVISRTGALQMVQVLNY